MSNPIPTASRDTVRQRDNSQCQRCGVRGTDYHHRRSRRVRDEHVHCPCNGVWLCRGCHSWAHGHPAAARDDGLILSMHEDSPSSIPMRTFAGRVTIHCDGGYAFAR